jgi:cyclopropane-fatty-acyl-phospholipid synthase
MAGHPDVRVRLWTGEEQGAAVERSAGTLVVADPGAFLRLCVDPDTQIGDLYTEGRLRVEGRLERVLAALLDRRPKAGWLAKLLPAALRERALRSALDTGLARSRENAQHHYDVGNEFYKIWLDERMVYTCAYFPTPDATLEEAQLAKMDHVCRKIALRPGEEVVEAGCGWGSLALHMARYYGVRVRACNVSSEQVAYAREQAEKQGLADRVEFIEDDYRNLTGQCDAFVSVGMLEHVGLDHYEMLGRVIERTLRPRGRGLLHTIGRSQPQPLNRWTQKRVFPNAHPPTLGEMMRIFEPRDFAVLDVENLRLHYRETVRLWLQRYEAAMPRIEALVGERLARTWQMYLAGTWASFASATIQLYQVVFTRAVNDAIPWTRAHQYGGETDGFEAIEPGAIVSNTLDPIVAGEAGTGTMPDPDEPVGAS